MPKYSLITPVYNRPDEVEELLSSLSDQTFKDFEVLIIEDGSSIKCEKVCENYSEKLDIRYVYKDNTGQGFSRNLGFELAKGSYFIQLDSDAIIPKNYLAIVNESLNRSYLDAFGGPDAAHESFTPIQKAVNYAMTSIFTTGGIRGKSNNLGGQFHPRSFNFGLSRAVWEKVGGYKITRMGEDIEFSIRIIENGFKVGLIPEAFIYHKRRTSLGQFYKQLHFFGRARINISRFFPSELKLVHFFPALFTCFCIGLFLSIFFSKALFYLGLSCLLFYFSLIFIDSFSKTKSLKVAILSLPACFIQLFAYGVGFITERFSNPNK